ncbi:MAG: type VI secretion system tube protein Hcp [bacterium]
MAVNVFWKFNAPDVVGSSLMKGQEGKQEIISYSHAFEQLTNPVRSAAGGGTIERAHHGTFNMTQELDEAFIPMLKLLWSGKHIEKGTLMCYRSAGDTGGEQMGVPYLKMELEAIVITHLDISGGPGELPTVNFALNYAKCTYTYTPVDHSKGTAAAAIPVSHDLRTNVVA